MKRYYKPWKYELGDAKFPLRASNRARARAIAMYRVPTSAKCPEDEQILPIMIMIMIILPLEDHAYTLSSTHPHPLPHSLFIFPNSAIYHPKERSKHPKHPPFPNGLNISRPSNLPCNCKSRSQKYCYNTFHIREKVHLWRATQRCRGRQDHPVQPIEVRVCRGRVKRRSKGRFPSGKWL